MVPLRRITRPVTTLAVAALVSILAAACVGGPKTPRADEVTPLPGGYRVVADQEVPCRDGEAGFQYRFLVIEPNDLSADSALLKHLRDRGFYRTIVDPSYDLPWATVGYNIDKIKVRLTAGPLDAYVRSPKAFTGPVLDQLPEEVRANPGRYTLLALRPYDFACDTPL